MTSHINMINITLKLFIWLYIHHIIWFFWINTSLFEINAWNFWYFNLMSKPLAFWALYIFIKVAFPFSSQILVYATAFAAHYLFSFWDLHLLSSLSNKNKRVERDISISLRMYQNQHDYWLIIHDKLEDRFTTITQRCQDFSHNDISAKITS